MASALNLRDSFNREEIKLRNILQASQANIESWFPGVINRIMQFAGQNIYAAGAIYVEDAASGTLLLEKFPQVTQALPHAWTSEGKDLRAYSAQAYFNGGRVRLADYAATKKVSFKGVTINHLWQQLNAFVLGDKEASKRADDLLDAAVYGASMMFREQPQATARRA